MLKQPSVHRSKFQAYFETKHALLLIDTLEGEYSIRLREFFSNGYTVILYKGKKRPIIRNLHIVSLYLLPHSVPNLIEFKIGFDGNVPTKIASFQKSNYVFSTEGGIRSTSGDIYIEEVGKGVIMTSPNGNCWRVTVSNSGGFISTQVTCP